MRLIKFAGILGALGLVAALGGPGLQGVQALAPASPPRAAATTKPVPAKAARKDKAAPRPEAKEGPRTLEGYVEQEKAFYDFLKKNHPMFKDYEKNGRIVGKYQISDREEEFVEFGGGKDYQAENARKSAITYRLGMESILDLPNNFVGSAKCGECHPAQYEKWARSRHAKVIRFPDELEEIPGKDLTKGLYGTKASVLAPGITPDMVYAVIGTPRTKYGFLDAWLVRGTYHIEGGTLRDRTGTLVAGGNQFSRSWSESLTPDMARKIAAWVPGFPTTLEAFGDQGSAIWGMNSYGAKNRKSMLFQPASSYCEVCHTFKFDFKSQEELMAALGKPEELRKHTIARGIGCEECHGAGGHLMGAKGGGATSNCERCHQRFVWNKDEAAKSPRNGFNAYFKSSCPSCGTEGSQSYYTAHTEHGMTCGTCHDPHEVTANDWKDPYTVPGLRKKCQDCHATQGAFLAMNEIHGGNNCTSCHMPVMGSCENFASIQYPDYGGFDTQRASHIWKILVDPDAKTMNPPEGKGRDYKGGAWRLTKNNGKPYIDLMWSCGRTSWGDPDLAATGGCHSPAQSAQPKGLLFTNQKMIYDKVVGWQKPVKDGVAELEAQLKTLRPALAASPAAKKDKAQIQLMLNQTQEILDTVRKDGSWGVHAPAYSRQKVDEGRTLLQGAQAMLLATPVVAMKAQAGAKS